MGLDYRAGLRCLDCGESDTVCLDFHHLNPALKDYSVSELINKRYSAKKIEEEIAKCVVLCSNCHRKLHRLLREELKNDLVSF